MSPIALKQCIFQVPGLFQTFDKFIQVEEKWKIFKEENQNTELFLFPKYKDNWYFQILYQGNYFISCKVLGNYWRYIYKQALKRK